MRWNSSPGWFEGHVRSVRPSIVQRKVLAPNDFPDLGTLEQRLLAFGRRYEQIAAPFQWKFTRADLDRLAQRLELPTTQAA